MLEPARDDIQALMETYSAQQLGGTPTISMPLMGRYVSSQAATAGASTFPVDAILHDAATLAGQSALRNTTLQLGPKEILGGSGDLSIDLVNTGLVSPGTHPASSMLIVLHNCLADPHCLSWEARPLAQAVDTTTNSMFEARLF